MTRACLSLLAGMYALQLSSFAETSNYLNTVFVAGFVLLVARQWWMLSCFLTGAALFFFAAQQLIESRLPANIAGDSIVVSLEVAEFPSHSGNTLSFVAIPVDDARLGPRIRLSWFEPPVDIRIGDRWRLEVRLQRPRGSRNPGVFDFEAWLFREGISAVGYVVNSRRNHLLGSSSGLGRDQIRGRFVERIAALIDDREPAAVLIALVVGSRHLLSATQWERYAATGTSHLMAISGLHIGLAAGGAYVIALALAGLIAGAGSRGNHHHFAIVGAALVALMYAEIAGFAVPARRASLMLVLAAVVLLRRRRPKLATIVAAACLLIAISNPLSTMAPGFILSFAAVVILIWIGQRRANLATLQVMLLCGLLPLTALLFDRISLAALPVNLLAVPLFSFVVVPLSLLGFLLDGVLRPLGDPLLLLAAESISLLERALHVLAEQPWASFRVPKLAGAACLYLAVPVLWVVLPPGWPGRYLAWLGVAAILVYGPSKPAPGCVTIDVLDVGQGLAVAIHTQHRVLLYDTGPAFRSGGSAADYVVLPYMSHLAVFELDWMIVSHSDLDHAGGIATILENLPVRRILAGEALSTVRAVRCRAGQSWSADDVRFRVLHPETAAAEQGNDSSCVLLLEIGRYRILFTGDIEKMSEQSLLRKRALPRVDVVLVPHHGSRTSSIAAFVSALQPSIAIVSSAYGHHWGFPKADVVERWQAVGAEVLNTATSGAINLRVCAETGIESVGEYRHNNRRIWHE